MLEVVQRAALERRFVDGGHVPGGDHDAPDAERDRRSREHAEELPQRPESRDRPEHGAGKEEEHDRTGHGDDDERHGCVADQDVLQHVRRQEVLLGDRVERRDERQHPE